MTKEAKEPKRRSIKLGDTAIGVVEHIDSVAIADGFSITVNGLIIEGKPTIDQFEKVGKLLRVAEKCSQFAIGDYILQANDRFGEEASQLIDATEWSWNTISNYRWIADRIAPDRRRMDRLGIRHHQLVAPMAANRQEYWLNRAAADNEEEPWTVARLKKAIDDGDDAPITGWHVLVKTTSEKKQKQIMAKLEREGFETRAIFSRKRKAE